MIKIGDFYKLTKISVKTLRYYDEIGILKPTYIDNCTSYRYYSIEQVETANKIMLFKSVGLSISDIKKFFKYENEDIHDTLLQRIQNINEDIDILKRQKSKIDRLLSGKDTTTYKAEIKHNQRSY